MNNKFCSFILISLITLSACTREKAPVSSSVISSSSFLSSDTNSSTSLISSNTSDDDIPIEDGMYVASFQHIFKKDDFVAAGGQTKAINGVVWEYSSFKYLGGASQGVQIGSANNVQNEAWTIKTSFPEGVKVVAYNAALCTANQGSSTFKVQFGEYTKSGNIYGTVLYDYSDNGFSHLASSFSLTLLAYSKAIYLNSISFTVLVPDALEYNISGDNDIAFEPITPGVNNIPATTYELTTVTEYYKNINFEDKNYLTSLKELITEMTKYNYGDAKYILQYTDEMIGKYGYDYGMWDGDQIIATWDGGASWNREHVWPCAQMRIGGIDPRPSESTKNHATDLHNLRVACQLANGKHSNLFVDYEPTAGLSFFPNIIDGLNGRHAYEGDFRGDTARIYFYMAMRYDDLKLTSDLLTADELSMGNLTALLDWNLADPVDEFEIQRNNRIFQYQGNRNPFIDYPELGNIIYG